MALIKLTSAGLARSAGLRDKKGYATIRDAAILTGSHVDTDVVDMQQFSDASVLMKIVKGSITGVEYKIYHSTDQTDWFQDTVQVIAAASVTETNPAHTITVSADINPAIIFPVLARFVKFSVKGNGSVSGSSLEVSVVGVN